LKRTIAVLISGMFLFITVSLFATPQLLKQHKQVKAAKKITKCEDCHNKVTQLPKQKSMNAAYKKLYKTKNCAAPGCHK